MPPCGVPTSGNPIPATSAFNIADIMLSSFLSWIPIAQSCFSSFPWFAVLFIACIGINSLGIIPKQAVSVINSLDIFMLTMAMCALGMETSLEKVRMVGPKPFLLAGVLALWLIGGGYFVTRFILSLNF